MSLQPGKRLGPYEILEPLGAGGMGEVYRARDNRLGREIAIKVLPAAFTKDPDRLGRFDQEARAAGVLNHPNLLAVFDVDISGPIPYLVSELLEGETLRSKLAYGPLPPRRTLDYGVQIARGLAAAHDKGIVHRDLKPENVFITRDGRVKILDFGLAKLTAPDFGESGGTAGPTMAVDTQPGAVLGTVGYMSPEQVRGQRVDPRSDLFSVGAILYEMLSGRRAFEGDSAIDTMSAVLKQDPPELSQVGRGIPPALERIVGHCLEKDPVMRFQTARDLAFDLEAVVALSGSSTALHPESSPLPRRRLWRWIGAAAVLLAVIAAALAGLAAPDPRVPPTFQQLTYRRGAIEAARFGPDGQSILYGASWGPEGLQPYVTRPESPESRPLGIENADVLAISSLGQVLLLRAPEGTRIFGRKGTLAQVSLTGGAPRDLLENIEDAEWDPAGEALAIVRAAGEGEDSRLEYPVGTVLYETAGYLSYPRFSPDGRFIAFIEHPNEGDDGGRVAVVQVPRNGTGDSRPERRTLSEGWSSIQGLDWSSDGQEIWFGAATRGNRNLHAVDLNGNRRVVYTLPGSLTLHDVAPDGRVLITRDMVRQEVAGGAPGTAEERDLSLLDWSLPIDLSTDGRFLLLNEAGEGGGSGYSVYLRPTDGSPAVRLGDGLARALSPDAKWALVQPRDARNVLRILPTGAGDARSLETSFTDIFFADWHPSGESFIVVGLHPGYEGPRLFSLGLEGGQPELLVPVPPAAPGGAISPDAKELVLSIPDRGWVRMPLGGGDALPLAGLQPGDLVLEWSDDGNFLYVAGPPALPREVFRVDVQSGRRELWKTLAPTDPAGVPLVTRIVTTRTGDAYVYGYPRGLSELYLVEGLR